MKKSGQLTIFIILAIVIIAAVFLFFAIQTDFIKQPSNPDTERIRNFVQSCIEEESIRTIYQIGQNGGYYFPTNLSTESGVAIYYQNGKTYVPIKEQIEDEISFFLNQKLFFCIKNFVDFPDLEISQKEAKTKTKIQENKIVFNVNYPITIRKGEDVSTLNSFETEIPVRMGIVYDSIMEFMQKQTESEGICLSC